MFESEVPSSRQPEVIIREGPHGWMFAAVPRRSSLAAYLTRLASAWNDRRTLSVTRSWPAPVYGDPRHRDAAEGSVLYELTVTAIRQGLVPVTAPDLRWSVLSRDQRPSDVSDVSADDAAAEDGGTRAVAGWVRRELTEDTVLDRYDTVLLDGVMLVMESPKLERRPGTA